jgi:hypothetical protein
LARGFDTESDGQVRLSGADRAGEDQIVGAVDPLSACELGDLCCADDTVGPAKSKESALLADDASPPSRGAKSARQEHFVQKLLVAPVVFARLAGERLEDAHDAGHLERAGLRDDHLPGDDSAAHAAPRPSSAS